MILTNKYVIVKLKQGEDVIPYLNSQWSHPT